MQTITHVDITLKDIEHELKNLHNQIDAALKTGDIAKAGEWVAAMNNMIRQLDHAVEKLGNP